MPGLAETAELAVRISLKDNASAGLKGLQHNVASLGSSLGRVGKGVGQVGAGLARAGVVIGGAVAGGLALAAKTAIDFEDAFAGVRKTVEGSPQQLDEMYQGLRKLATRIPVKFTDLAGIAQEAGALGVARKDVVGFTDVVARLSAATVGLSTDAAAEAFGKLGNVLFTTQQKADGLIDEYNRMGSALVALGNAGASSEGDIIEVAKRFGAAGHAAGLTAAQILGISSALASLGVEPEAAGGALSRLLNNLTTNLALGNKKAQGFASVLGLTAKQAKTAFGKDALGTFEKFLQKLSTLDKFSQAKVLKAAGITNVRDINAIRLLSQQYAEVDRQVKLSTKAYQENVDLQKVSEQRFNTLKNKLIELKNLFFDSAVTIAEGFTPALGRAADKIRELVIKPDTQNSLKAIGKDIGDAIDKINWSDVISGTKELVGLFKGALSVALDIAKALDKLPGPIKEAGLGFLALNKLSGGLIGTGLGNIVGGLGSAITKGIASKIPGLGKLVATPVFVTNWPMGGLGGGVGGVGGAAGGISTLGKVALVGEGLALAGIVESVREGIADASTKQAQGLRETLDQSLAGPQSVSQLQQKLAGINQGIDALQSNPLNVLVQGDALNQLQQMRAEVVARLETVTRNTSNSPDARDERARQNAAAIAAKIDASRVHLSARLDGEKTAIVAAGHNDGAAIVGAIRANRPIVNVRVNVAHGDTIRVTKNYQSGQHMGRTGGPQEFN